MARISGVTIPVEKQVETSLTYIYGIGPAHAKQILTAANVDPTTRVKDLTEAELDAIRSEVDSNYTVEGDLQRIVTGNIKRLKDTQSYKGTRHKLGLPVHGQRTRTNGRTKRGKRIAVGGTQKKAASKT